MSLRYWNWTLALSLVTSATAVHASQLRNLVIHGVPTEITYKDQMPSKACYTSQIDELKQALRVHPNPPARIHVHYSEEGLAPSVNMDKRTVSLNTSVTCNPYTGAELVQVLDMAVDAIELSRPKPVAVPEECALSAGDINTLSRTFDEDMVQIESKLATLGGGSITPEFKGNVVLDTKLPLSSYVESMMGYEKKPGEEGFSVGDILMAVASITGGVSPVPYLADLTHWQVLRAEETLKSITPKDGSNLLGFYSQTTGKLRPRTNKKGEPLSIDQRIAVNEKLQSIEDNILATMQNKDSAPKFMEGKREWQVVSPLTIEGRIPSDEGPGLFASTDNIITISIKEHPGKGVHMDYCLTEGESLAQARVALCTSTNLAVAQELKRTPQKAMKVYFRVTPPKPLTITVKEQGCPDNVSALAYAVNQKVKNIVVDEVGNITSITAKIPVRMEEAR